MVPRKPSLLESAVRVLLSALALGVLFRILWEALKFGWSLLGVAP